jgi:hypothetical protein
MHAMRCSIRFDTSPSLVASSLSALDMEMLSLHNGGVVNLDAVLNSLGRTRKTASRRRPPRHEQAQVAAMASSPVDTGGMGWT